MCGGRRHSAAFAGRRIARAHEAADLNFGKTLPQQLGPDAGHRRGEIALDVVGKGLERGDVDDLRLVFETAVEALAHQRINGGEKGSKRLATAGGCRNQHMPAGLNCRPRFRLGRRRLCEGLAKPPGDGGVERVWTGHVR